MPAASLDTDIFVWVVDHRVGWLDPVFVALSVVGYAGLVWIALAPLLLLWRRRPFLAPLGITAATVWLADLLSLGLKHVSARARPFEEELGGAEPLLQATVGQSMPSGHAATSFAGAVVLTYLLRRGWPFFFLLAAAIAFSRVYVGVHYPLDVLAGAALGAAVGLGSVTVLRARRRSAAALPRSEEAPPAG